MYVCIMYLSVMNIVFCCKKFKAYFSLPNKRMKEYIKSLKDSTGKNYIFFCQIMANTVLNTSVLTRPRLCSKMAVFKME